MAIIQAIKQHEDEFDPFVSDDDEELGESQFNPSSFNCYWKVEELLQVHEVPSYSRVALTSEVGYEIICDSIRLLLSIEKEVYYMYRRQFPEAAESSLVQKSIIDCINEAGNEVHDESFQKLLDLRKKLLDFVDSWMTYLAPNLSAIVGTTVGAKLMATAGGLEPLARMSPCNIQHMGFLNISLDGLPIKLTHGYLQESEISQTFPLAVTRGATRVLASNCSAAARFDFKQNDPSGNTGKHLREVVINKFRRYG
ncbi:U4/U6-U5 snRNP complex subunit prp31 [Orobanche gracilis]